MGNSGASRLEEVTRARTAFAGRFLQLAGLEAMLHNTDSSSDLVRYDVGKDARFRFTFYQSWPAKPGNTHPHVDITYHRHVACTPVNAIAMSDLFGTIRIIAKNYGLDFDIGWPVLLGQGNIATVGLKLRINYIKEESTYKPFAEGIGLIHRTMQAYLAESTGR